MTKYVDTIYPEDKDNKYPSKLAKYLYDRFMKFAKTGAQPAGEKRKILDIGCSTGEALRRFAEFEDFDLYGVDIRIEDAPDINFKKCNIEQNRIKHPDNYFDFVYSKSVLEHVRNTDNFISEALRVLKPDGVFVALTPDWKSQQSIFWDDYTHVKPFTRKGLRDCLKIKGFEESNCEYFYQLPFLWKYPSLSFIAKLIALVPDSWKWKDKEQRNTKDRKLIRFSKEKMLLCYGVKK
tara:strand:- start:11400 stop:12107 length:708 start_codon:yes stop_codon:yes gene_type:complete